MKKVSDETLAAAVSASYSVLGVLRAIGRKQAGGNHTHYSRRIIDLGLDTSHFRILHNKGVPSPKRRRLDQILIKRDSGPRTKQKFLYRALIESGFDYVCSKCGQPPEWLGNPLTLDIDHINGNWLDDRLENIRFLCPNCHSQFSRNLIKLTS